MSQVVPHRRRQNHSTNSHEVVPYKLSGRPDASGRFYHFEAKMRQHFAGYGDWNLVILKADVCFACIQCGRLVRVRFVVE